MLHYNLILFYSVALMICSYSHFICSTFSDTRGGTHVSSPSSHSFSNAPWSERDCVCVNLLWCTFSFITCSCFQHGSCTVALEQMYLCSPLLSCPCTLVNTLRTRARDQQPFKAEVLHPCLWECSANYKAKVLYFLIIYLRPSFSMVYVEAYSFPPGPV